MLFKKEIIKNFLNFGVIDFIGLLVPVLIMPILTRTLGADAYGIYLLIFSILFFGHTIIDYGTQYTSVREVANNKQDFDLVKKVFLETQSIRVIFSLVYCLICICYAAAFLAEDVYRLILYAAPLYLVGYALIPTWYFQAQSNMGLITKVSFLIKLVHVLVVVLFVREQTDLFLTTMSMGVPMFIGGIVLLIVCSKSEKLDVRITLNVIPRVKSGVHVFIGLLAPNLYNSIPTIFLGTSFPPDQFAKFAIASRLCQVVVTLQNVLSKALYPVLARLQGSKVKGMLQANTLISIPPLAVISLFGEELLGFLLGPEFAKSNEYLVILTVGVFFIGLANAVSQGYFLPKGLDALYKNISLRVSLLSGLVTLFLVSEYGLFGGALSITIARFLFFADFSFTYYFKLMPKHSIK
ncbi:oligosaccharide flippase family protein [Pseudoalteromonas luteoviolacea]|uniref:oligosaccharide flippase family protein n=1 Tax=Pseudoalteromonas luteoviolacea TaxID=43657 RepID=UPI001EED1541|nr:oligosaccharide flippase family protein [Pseudoalteromonas luteoviolacea]MCF6439062.1 oligosaccharide flippase family protein [Pseudoalteromonas luteoviolacea]